MDLIQEGNMGLMRAAEKYDYTEKIEGYFKGEWIVFDFPQITLHIFLQKVREKYNLDKLYKPKKISI